MIRCNKEGCGGKVFVDMTFTDNADYEAFCLSCGKRDFVSKSHPLYSTFDKSVKAALHG